MNTYTIDCYIEWSQYVPLTIEATNADDARHIATQLLLNATRPVAQLRKGKMVVEKVTDERTGDIE